jgi:hypothetical protein
MERRHIRSKKRYFLAFLIGTAIFILGFSITYGVSYLEYQRVSSLQGPVSYKIFEDKLKYTFFNEDICSEKAYLEISKDLHFHGSLISDIERRLGKDNEDVIFRKKFYSLVLLEHYELVLMQNENCGSNLNKINTILFFYSNEEQDVEDSEKIGELLSVIAQRNENNLIIYSFDVNLDSDVVRALKEKYKVDTPYKIIINQNQSFDRIENINEIESLFY